MQPHSEPPVRRDGRPLVIVGGLSQPLATWQVALPGRKGHCILGVAAVRVELSRGHLPLLHVPVHVGPPPNRKLAERAHDRMPSDDVLQADEHQIALDRVRAVKHLPVTFVVMQHALDDS